MKYSVKHMNKHMQKHNCPPLAFSTTGNNYPGLCITGVFVYLLRLQLKERLSNSCKNRAQQTATCAHVLVLSDSPGSAPPHLCSKLVFGKSSRASNHDTHVPDLAPSTPAPTTNLRTKTWRIIKKNHKKQINSMYQNLLLSSIILCNEPLRPSDNSTTYFVTSAPPFSLGGSKNKEQTNKNTRMIKE